MNSRRVSPTELKSAAFDRSATQEQDKDKDKDKGCIQQDSNLRRVSSTELESAAFNHSAIDATCYVYTNSITFKFSFKAF